jgi:hypothetical protein
VLICDVLDRRPITGDQLPGHEVRSDEENREDQGLHHWTAIGAVRVLIGGPRWMGFHVEKMGDLGVRTVRERGEDHIGGEERRGEERCGGVVLEKER